MSLQKHYIPKIMPSLTDDEVDKEVLKVCTAIVLYNAGLIHHLRSKTSSSMETAIRYQSCSIISALEENIEVCQLKIALTNNIIQLYKDLELPELSHAYLDYLKEFVSFMLHHQRMSEDTVIVRKQCELVNEATEILLNATVSMLHPQLVAEAA